MTRLLPFSLHDQEARSGAGWTVLPLTLAGLIAAHGWARWIAGGVTPFGEWLTAQGLPFGIAIAMAINAFECAGLQYARPRQRA